MQVIHKPAHESDGGIVNAAAQLDFAVFDGRCHGLVSERGAALGLGAIPPPLRARTWPNAGAPVAPRRSQLNDRNLETVIADQSYLPNARDWALPDCQ